MLLIKTVVKPSTIGGAGLGLFADEDIKKGHVVWRFCPGYDQIISKDDLLRMSKESRRQFLNYCYFDKETNHFILCGDDERFINHSAKPNIIQSKHDGEIEGVELAGRDIKRGEELFCDYYKFDKDADRKLNGKSMYQVLLENGNGDKNKSEEKPIREKVGMFLKPAEYIIRFWNNLRKKTESHRKDAVWAREYADLLKRTEPD